MLLPPSKLLIRIPPCSPSFPCHRSSSTLVFLHHYKYVPFKYAALTLPSLLFTAASLGSSISSFTCTSCTLIILLHSSASTPTCSGKLTHKYILHMVTLLTGFLCTIYYTIYSLCFCASYQTSKCKISLPMPACINSDLTTSFLTALLPIAMVCLLSYCFPTSILT